MTPSVPVPIPFDKPPAARPRCNRRQRRTAYPGLSSIHDFEAGLSIHSLTTPVEMHDHAWFSGGATLTPDGQQVAKRMTLQVLRVRQTLPRLVWSHEP